MTITIELVRRMCALGLFASLSGCGLLGEEEDGPLRCDYEQSSTGCAGQGFGPYEQRCLDIESPKEGLTPEGWCAIVTGDTLECASSCCVNYRFRNAVGSRGRCP